MSKSVEKRINKDKKLLLKKLRKTPVVQVACQKAGVGRSTYYRWRKEDKKFAKKADKALAEGTALINDMAESQLLSAIRDQNMTSIIFWLKHHHKAYTTRVEIAPAERKIEELSPKQEAAVKKALQLADLVPKEEKEKKDDN